MKATCSETDCARPAKARGMCKLHYDRDYYRRVVLPTSARVCPMCGPFYPRRGPECPTCGLTPGEHAYRARILADSTAVYAEEARAYRAQRGRVAS